ncbi:MAG: nitroreductase [archaeon]|nr:nitroreductase [archaeon]
MDVIKKRRSIRKFTDEKVPEEILERILEAGRLSPTWSNQQGIRYIVVREKENVEKVAEGIGQKWTKYANTFIVVCIKPKDSGKCGDIQYFTVDAAIGMEHIVLAATNEGLGTCWTGFFNEEVIKEALAIPKRVRIVAITPIGYSMYTPRPQERKPLSEIAFREKFKESW